MLLATINIQPLHIEIEDLSEEELEKFNSFSDDSDKIKYIKSLIDDFILDIEVILSKNN